MNFVSCCEFALDDCFVRGLTVQPWLAWKSTQIRLHHAQLIPYFKRCLYSENESPVMFISSPGDPSFHKKKLISFSFLLLTNTKKTEENKACLLTPSFGNFEPAVPSLQNRISKEHTKNVAVLKLHNCRMCPDISASIYSTLS